MKRGPLKPKPLSLEKLRQAERGAMKRKTLRALKKAGVWVAGAAAGEGSQPYARTDLAGDVAIVIGAEGDGISPVVRKECDFLVSIPLYGKLESLNASVAAGVLLFEAQRQRAARP